MKLKLIQEVIDHYVVQEREKWIFHQEALLIWDVFRGQMTAKADFFNVKCSYVPTNVTQFFQPLDFILLQVSQKFHGEAVIMPVLSESSFKQARILKISKFFPTWSHNMPIGWSMRTTFQWWKRKRGDRGGRELRFLDHLIELQLPLEDFKPFMNELPS